MKTLFIRLYVAVLSSYFGHIKVPLSKLMDRFRPKAHFRLPTFHSLEEYGQWTALHLRWKLDRLGGLLDIFPSLEHAAWELETKGFVEDDCDGLAYIAAQGALQLADSPDGVYVVTLVLNPAHVALSEAAHVICVFRRRGRWHVVSNGRLEVRHHPSFWTAVTQNAYARGRKILFVETRDAALEKVETLR